MFKEGMASRPRWIWISLSTTKRHIDIMGDPSSPSVALGNLLSARFALLCLVAICCSKAFWMVPVKKFSTIVLFKRFSSNIYIYTYNIGWLILLVSPGNIIYIHIWAKHIDFVLVLAHIRTGDFLSGKSKVEQPGSSRLKDSPYYVHLLQNCGPAFFTRTWLGLWGHWCCKATQLYGST